jgi:hypothetical protein
MSAHRITSPYDQHVNGELAALAAVAAYGSPWLAGAGANPAPDLLGSNSCFQFVHVLVAELPANGLLRRTGTVQGTAAWLAALRERGVDRLVLLTNLPMSGDLPPHIASAFANAGGWGLLASGAVPSTLWTVRWDVGAPNAPDSRIWDLTATSTPFDHPQPPVSSVEDARSILRSALREIEEFANRSGLDDWSPWFARAEALLDAPAPSPPYHADMLPSDASLQRRQLAAAAVQAWVFGGMGSWNDMGPSDSALPGEYEQVSRQLYDALLNALSAATYSQ